MSSDSRNSTMAKAMDLIFRCSAREVPFWHAAMHTMHYSWTYQGPPFCPIHLCSPQKGVNFVVDT